MRKTLFVGRATILVAATLFCALTAHAEKIQLVASEYIQIEVGQKTLLLGQRVNYDDSYVEGDFGASCVLKFDAKNYAREIKKGDAFVLDSNGYTSDKISPTSREELEYHFSLLSGDMTLPENITTLEQFKEYLKGVSGGGVEVTDWPTEPISMTEMSIISENSRNAYKVRCRHTSPSLSLEQIVDILAAEGILKPSSQF